MCDSIVITIRAYMNGKKQPSAFDLRCFIGMIETGEATLDDFQQAGGEALASIVQKQLERNEYDRRKSM